LQSLAAADGRVRHLPVSFPSGDSSRKKNAGAAAARAEIVAFLDDDVVVSPDWPEKMLAAFADPAVGLVSGPGLVPDGISLFARLAGVALASRAAGYVAERYVRGRPEPRRIAWSRIIGCNMAYRKSVLVALGGFDPAFWPGEEMIAAHRAQKAGHVLLFNPEAWVCHYPRQSFARFWRQMHGYGATRVRLIRAGAEFEPATIVPALWVLSLLILGGAAPFSGLARALLLLDVCGYLAADAWITISKVAETGRAADLLTFLLIPVMHLSYGIAEWIEFFRPGRDLSEKSG
jgi:GT2 family glycosyltransferase